MAGAAIVLLAWWLRNPLLPYDGDSARASGFSTSSGAKDDPQVRRLTALRELRQEISNAETRLRAAAGKALDAPSDAEQAFAYAEQLQPGKESGIVVEERGVPLAWSGQIKTGLTDVPAGTIIYRTPFYTALQVAVTRGARRAVATALIHAEPPANRIAIALDDQMPSRKLVRQFRFGLPADSAGELVRAANGAPLMRIDASPLPADVLRFANSASARAKGTVLMSIAVLVLLAFAWSDRRAIESRILAVVISFVAVALVPWNNFSNYAGVFDPAYYYLSAGGPLSANSGVLCISAVLLLLAVFAIVRSRRERVTKIVAFASGTLFAVAGAIVATAAATGISVPRAGSTIVLWLWWEVPLFLILFACWLAATWLLRIGFGKRGAVPMRTAAMVAMATGALAVFFVWRVTTEQRLALAARDVASLQSPDGDAAMLLSRFATQFGEYGSPGSRADLLKRYVTTDLAAADLQVSLGTWTADGVSESALQLAPLAYDSVALSEMVAAAIASGRPAIRETLGPVGRELILAVPHPDGGATSAVVSPRTLLVEQNPYAMLLGFAVPAQAEPPYTLTLADVSQPGLPPGRLVWRRAGDEWHGDKLILTSRGQARAHAEVELRSWPTRIVRGSLIVILDVAIAGFLWALGAMAEGGFWRWVRRRASRWLRSYRGRLTLALFLFFMVPAIAFATWSYQRLLGDDRGVREALVDETLRHASGGDRRGAGSESDNAGIPLFLYSNGLLTASNDSLYAMLSPSGSALPAPVQLSLAVEGELTSSSQQTLAGTRVFWGYRATTLGSGQRVVLSAPARSDELVLDRRRRDLTLLVLFATALAAIAAFWLSGVAARVLARDLELSRIEVSRAERVLAWGEMARQVAHEIKNPLTPIRLGVQHLRRARHDPCVDFDRVLNENVTRILSEIDHLDKIARAFSRYGSAASDLPPAGDLDVAAILRDVIGLERIGIGGVAWTLDGAEEPVVARALGDELRDVLLNVFENARLARARNVHVRLLRGDRTVTIEVSDDGAGIPSAALNRVFEPHFSTRTTGSGLGLAISRRLLESWGGKIDLESEEGRGAKILITMQSALT